MDERNPRTPGKSSKVRKSGDNKSRSTSDIALHRRALRTAPLAKTMSKNTTPAAIRMLHCATERLTRASRGRGLLKSSIILTYRHKDTIETQKVDLGWFLTDTRQSKKHNTENPTHPLPLYHTLSSLPRFFRYRGRDEELAQPCG